MRRAWILVAAVIVSPARAEVPDDWVFKPVRPQPIPSVSPAPRSPIDAFLLQRLRSEGLGYSAPADRPTLLRRLAFDMTGLPPTPAELDAFLKDDSPRAYEAVVERLMASPAFGERQALPWLDVARFAETDGFKADDPRPAAWRYRDYVIRSLNADKPFDRFIREQLAGDELFSDDPDAMIATAFLRHYPDEYNAVNLEQRRQEILNDITDTTAQAFLGVTLACARCHDHKFDPITQEDYYRIQAFFAGWNEAEAPLLPQAERTEHARRLREWESKTATIRKQLAELEAPYRTKFEAKRRGRFPEEYASLLDIPEEKRTPMERQIAAMVAKQVYAPDEKAMLAGMKGPEKEKHEALKKQLAEAGPKPQAMAVAMAFTDVGRDVPPTHLLKRGNWRKKGEVVRPGFLSAFDDRFADVMPPKGLNSTGRRSVFANWVADPKNPLTARVIVNRVWQHYFGRGIVGSAGDLGFQGERPSHPELLDWLAADFVAHGWSLKRLHRQIVTTDAYRQSSAPNAAAAKEDPENLLLWRMNRRRLDGEALRDAVLSVAGSLNPKAGGPSVFPELPTELKAATWPVTASPAERDRRSVYVYVKRNLRYPLFAAFDATDRNEACSRRFETTTAPQALMLLNDAGIATRAKQFAARVTAGGASSDEIIDRAYRSALSRLPTSEERTAALGFLEAQTKKSGRDTAVADFCHAVLNLNEFLYVD
jgi:hypothetical protein